MKEKNSFDMELAKAEALRLDALFGTNFAELLDKRYPEKKVASGTDEFSPFNTVNS
jgi:hypothetical protein